MILKESHWVPESLGESQWALCSRNFQNLKLRLYFVDVWSFCCHSDFTWNQILAKSDGQKMLFWQFSNSELWIFGKFGIWKLLKFAKKQNLESLNFTKMTFWTVWIHQNLISRKIWVAVKRSNLNKVKP